MMHLNKNLNFWQKTLFSMSFVFIVAFIFFTPFMVLAQNGSQGSLGSGGNGSEGVLKEEVNTRLKNPIGADNLNDFIKTILEGAIKIGIPIVAIAIIYSGFLYVTAMGNEEKLKTAHKAILYTLIGAVLLIGSWAIAQLISDTVLSL